jgi:hypothetical protein
MQARSEWQRYGFALRTALGNGGWALAVALLALVLLALFIGGGTVRREEERTTDATTVGTQPVTTALERSGERGAVKQSRHVVLPPLIHLTWRNKTDLPAYGVANAEHWRRLNPRHRVVLYDDVEVEAFVKLHVAEMVPFWEQLKPIQRADVFRYAVMWKDGGVYADLDVEPLRPVDEWMATGTRDTLHWRSANVILGWEAVTESEDWESRFASPAQLCTWTVASAPGHALWRSVLDDIVQFYKSGGHKEAAGVIRSTGGGMFSAAFKSFLKRELGAVVGQAPLTLRALKRSHLHAGDVLVLKPEAFAIYNSEDAEEAGLVRHGFAGSWKEAPKRVADVAAKATGETLDTVAGEASKQMEEMRRGFEQRITQLEVTNSHLRRRLQRLRRKPRKLATGGQERRYKERPPAKQERGATWSEVAARQAKREEFAPVRSDSKRAWVSAPAQWGKKRSSSSTSTAATELSSSDDRETGERAEQRHASAGQKRKPFNHGMD